MLRVGKGQGLNGAIRSPVNVRLTQYTLNRHSVVNLAAFLSIARNGLAAFPCGQPPPETGYCSRMPQSSGAYTHTPRFGSISSLSAITYS